MSDIELNALSSKIIGCAIDVHRVLGPGLLESVYQACLHYKLVQSGLQVVRERPVPVVFEEVKLECGFRLDLFVGNKIIVECKSVNALADIHTAQILTYLKLTNAPLGLLINFNVTRLKEGIHRIKNGY